ncbi:hypothetical protein WJW69_003987 [Salmonella enterica]
MNNIQLTVILPELPFITQDEESKLSPYQQGLRHGRETMLDEVKTALMKAGVRYQGISELKKYDNIPVRFAYYQSNSKDAWKVRVMNIRYVNPVTRTSLNEPEVIFVYISSDKYGEMPLSEFNQAYSPLLTSTASQKKRSRTNTDWSEPEKENNDYSNYF